jgi:hypothetical protein
MSIADFLGKHAKTITIASFSEKVLEDLLDSFADEGLLFTNERQFQLKVAQILGEIDAFKGLVKLEVVSVDLASPPFADEDATKNTYAPATQSIDSSYSSSDDLEKSRSCDARSTEKYYTDIVIENSNSSGGDIAIELKYKTAEDNRQPAGLNLKTKCICYWNDDHSVLIPLFAQGAPNIGSYRYLQDVERIERLVFGAAKGQQKRIVNQIEIDDGIDYSKVHPNRKIVRGYAVILTNESVYWRKDKPNSLAMNFFCLPGIEIANQRLWKAYVKSDGLVCHKGEKDQGKLEEISYQTWAKQTIKDKERLIPVKLAGHYYANWRPYNPQGLSVVCQADSKKKRTKGQNKDFKFQYLILSIPELAKFPV